MLSVWLFKLAVSAICIGLLMFVIGIAYLCIEVIKDNWGKDWSEVYLAIMIGLVIIGGALVLLGLAV